MRKMIRIMGFIAISMSFILAGCGANEPYQVYKAALSKTNEIEQGKSKFTLDIDMDWKDKQEADFSENKRFEIEQIEMLTEFDKDKQISKSNLYFESNGYGMEAVIFNQKKDLIIKSSVLPKLLIINKNEMQGTKMGVSEESNNQIKQLWYQLLTDKTVVQLGNIVLSTPDGEVKVKEYQVNLKGNDVKPVLLKTVDILSKDPVLSETIRKSEQQGLEKQELDKFWHDRKEWIQNGTIGDISFLAHIDRDGYVIDEKLEVSIAGGKNTLLNSLSFQFKNQRWDINQPIEEIQFPEISQENAFTQDEMESYLKKTWLAPSL